MQCRESKKGKLKQSPQHATTTLTAELKTFVKNCNIFLKAHIETAEHHISRYAQHVKEFFIQESTNPDYSCLMGSLLSKIANILQPFAGVKEKKKSSKGDHMIEELNRQLAV